MAVNVWLLFGANCILFCGILCVTVDVSNPKVTISQGVVVGSAAADNSYFGFYGIPFADSTTGINRFKAPSAPPLFQDEFLANRRNIKCVRALGIGYDGTEDCLVVDVLTPSLNSSSRLPVMVWIKGMELDTNNDLELSFETFLERNVVVVNLNYRESILGFLCLGTESAPGNAGLKDIIAGLRWIQQNAVEFGGDPNNVILFGHGSGAAAVDLVTLSPMAEGLVHKVIAQSGTALAPWAVTRNNLKYAIEVAEALGHNVDSLDTLSEVFSRTNIAALMAVINELDLTDNSLAFSPCIERRIDNVEPLLLKSPYQTLLENEQLPIPFITGFVDTEGTIRANEIVNNDWLERMDDSFIDFLQPDIDFISVEQEAQAAQEIRNFYFRSDTIDENKINEFLKYNGDTMILVSAIREARMRATSSVADVYLYQFSYKGTLSAQVLDRPIEIENAGHKEELVYMFSNDEQNDANSLDLAIRDLIVELWTNFAKTGSPTSEISQIKWRPFTSANNCFLRIFDDQEIIKNGNTVLDVNMEFPHAQTMTFWDQIYSQYFADASSRWTLKDKGVEDDETTDEGNNNENNGNGESGGDNNGDENSNEDDTDENDNNDNNNGEDDEDDKPDSASTTVGCTFAILSFFAILNKFHEIQTLS